MATTMTLTVTRIMENYSDPEDFDDNELDEFEDANDITLPQDMTLERAVEEAQLAVNYFFNNDFDKAKNLLSPYSSVSIYHSLGSSVFLFLEAILTFEQNSIIEASKALKQSLIVCNRFRKKNTIGESLGKMVKKNNFDQFTELEAHAELCHAECLLLKSMLTFMEDETLSSFIKAGIKIRSCYNSYKDCQQILMKKTWNKDSTKVHFESGVKMGIGTFNLMISMLPSRVIKLLEFIGFSGNKQLGLDDLHKGYRMDGIRQILCIMTLLGYNLIVMHVLSHREGDVKICEEILEKQLKKHPEGVWFLFFKGRLEFMKGDLDASLEWYTKSWKSQNVWPQFHHICFWELLWVHCLKTEWRQALAFSTHLIEDSRWSKSLYSYQKACIMIMIKDQLTPAELEEVDKLMKDVPKYKQRIAGKSLPMEKFAVKKSERYFAQNKTLILPVLELMFLWNLFKILKNFKVANNIFKLIEKEQINLNSSLTPSKYDTDNRALILLLKGACLRHMGSPLQALECFETVIQLQKEIVEDTYVVPYAIVELALIEWQNGKREKAILALEDAKKNYTGYSLESRLHFRIHTALSEYKAELKS
ncbi:tetratricopeptide repeat protein 39B isoform X1 [Aethina tumida]|uniref:tetratricopeptide repeat protein 39B isoform X1 n=2 Tax=Aethina tumida TaxID=116153 RepID=UPI00096ADCB3|nr:tetratricopeptide repeat protein 39B isoform X1 [Aethina tumida]